MSNNDQIDLFKIEDSVLDETLKILNSKDSSSFDNYQEQKSYIDILGISVSLSVKEELKSYLKSEAKKYLISLVVDNSMKLGDFKCYFDEEEECIIWSFLNLQYKIQGKWLGNEVIISMDECSSPLVVSSENGSDWNDITKNFIIQKYDILS